MADEPRYVELSGHMKAVGSAQAQEPPWTREYFENKVNQSDYCCFGEDAYVAYFWRRHRELNEGTKSSHSPGEGDVWLFWVDEAALNLFPELAGVDRILILETDCVPGKVPGRVVQI